MKKVLIFSTFLFYLNNLFAQSNFIHQDTVFGRTTNYAASIPICIDSVLYDSINSLRFTLDGQQFNGSVIPCTSDTIIIYAYTDIFRGNERGPWRLDSWTVNGRPFTGTFDNLTTLVDSMRLWEPSVDWRLEPISQTIIYGYVKNAIQYSCQNIIGLSRGGLTPVCSNISSELKGLRLSVPIGIHQLISEQISTGQRDTVVLVATCNTIPKEIIIDSTKKYILIARSSQQVLSIRNSNVSVAADAVQSYYTGGLNQKWAIKNADINSFNLNVEHTNMNLETRWGTTRNGSRLMQWKKSSSTSQKWLFIPVGNGYYKIINKASGRALSVNGGTTANVNNTHLVQLNYEGLLSQQWQIEVATQ